MTRAPSVRQALFDARLRHIARALVAKSAGDGEGWAEDDPQLPRIEQRATVGLLALWSGLMADCLNTLGLAEAGKAMKAEVPSFAFNAARHLSELLRLEELFVQAAGSDRGPLVRAAFAAWVRGLENAATELDVDAIIEDARRTYRAQIEARGLQMVRTVTARVLRDDIIERLKSGEYDGMNPVDVARKLRQRFGAHDYDWLRLARSETAMAQADGKLVQYRDAGITHVDYLTAQDGRVSRICRDLAAAGPYLIANAPVPVRDSHPNCRCSLVAADID